jgi:hypothetical protein
MQEAIDLVLTYGGGTILAHFHASTLDQIPLVMEYVDTLRAKGYR